MLPPVVLDAYFKQGFGAKARPHQLEATRRLLELLKWHQRSRAGGGAGSPSAAAGGGGGSIGPRALVQHAPGAGKTETILLLVFCALEEGLVDRAIILNYAVDLEEQLLVRAQRFWSNLGASFDVFRAESSYDLPSMLAQKRGAVLSLLQKFGGAGLCPAELPEADAARTLVVVDEAHRGIPEEGAYIQNVDLAIGIGAAKILFTATPRADTLRRFGTLRCDAASEGDVLFRAPFHTYTQRDSILTAATLNPLEKYVSAVPVIEVDGARLIDTATVPLAEFLERLNARRTTSALRSAWAEHVLCQLPLIDQDMPEMVRQGHQPKKLLVLSDMQEVFEMALELREMIQQRDLVNVFGQPLQVACFFSGRVNGAKSDREANSWCFSPADDASVLEKADLIVVCQKYTTGWDEWRVVAVFILRRLGSEALLQQLLGRAARSRPGSGKRRPWVFDYLNDPDWIFAAAARFYEECRAYQEPAALEGGGSSSSSGELWDAAKQVARFFPRQLRPLGLDAAEEGGVAEQRRGEAWGEDEAVRSAALRLSASDRALLRAALVRYLSAAAEGEDEEGGAGDGAEDSAFDGGGHSCGSGGGGGGGGGPLAVAGLIGLLRALNASMRSELFGGCADLASRSGPGAAADAPALAAPSASVGAPAWAGPDGGLRAIAKPHEGLPDALRTLGRTLRLRMKVARTSRPSLAPPSDVPTPQKRPRLAPDLRDPAAAVDTVLRRAVGALAEAYRSRLVGAASAPAASAPSAPSAASSAAAAAASSPASCSSPAPALSPKEGVGTEEALRDRSAPLSPSSPEHTCLGERYRERFVKDLQFAGARLRELGEAEAQVLLAAERELRRRLEAARGEYFEPWLRTEARRLEEAFKESGQNLGDDFEAAICEAEAEYGRCADRLGGRLGADYRAAFKQRLARAAAAKLSGGRQELTRQRARLTADLQQRLRAMSASLAAGDPSPEARADEAAKAVEEAVGDFRALAETLGGKQAACFAQSFEDSARRLLAQHAPLLPSPACAGSGAGAGAGAAVASAVAGPAVGSMFGGAGGLRFSMVNVVDVLDVP